MTDATRPTTTPPPEPPRDRARWTDWLRVAVPVAAIAALVLGARAQGYLEIDRPEEVAALAARVDRTPWLGVLLMAVYAGLAALAMPVAPLGYGAGALFGFGRGVLMVWVASIVGATAGYYLARGALHGPAIRLLGRFGGFVASLRERHGFMTVLRIQLLPLIAFGPANYAAGIARIPFLSFISATAVGIVPGTLAIVYVGDRVMAGIRGEDGHPFLLAALAGVALVALSFVPTLVLRRRRRRRRRAAASGQAAPADALDTLIDLDAAAHDAR